MKKSGSKCIHKLNVTFMAYKNDKRMAYLSDPQYRIDFRGN